MTTMWGIHNDHFGHELVDEGFISIGWDEVPDLRSVGDDPGRIKQLILQAVPHAKPGALPAWSGVLRRFAFVMREGDLVVAPRRVDSTLNFGVIVGPYEFHADQRRHPHRRRVHWTRTGVARSRFTQEVLHEVGSAITLFQIRRARAVFEAFLAAPEDAETIALPPLEREPEPPPAIDADPEENVSTRAIEEAPNADRINQHTRDFVMRVLLNRLSSYEFEQFVAALLQAMGYEARVTQRSGDGGIDVIAHRDPLGLEPPIIKVQCKQTPQTLGRPVVQQLVGALAHNELGLFVTLGTYSPPALDEERQRQNLRLLAGADIATLTLRHYADLAPEWRARIPLRQVLVVTHDPDLT